MKLIDRVNKLRTNKWIALLIISAVVVFALDYVNEYADVLEKATSKIIILGGQHNCDPQTSICSSSIKENSELRKIRFSIGQAITPLQAFPMKIDATGFDDIGITQITVEFEMLDMDMGQNVVTLTPIKKPHQIVSQVWEGEGRLPMCHDGRLDWVANIKVQTSESTYQSSYSMVINR